ncbi:MAG TPA: efflux RND transporter periplasmic adaptor subunit [Vicinamibacterales bacterium]|nr:efflux RND transporter periplasmic adaptor subunit [Vicinamibacterales bacterium]
MKIWTKIFRSKRLLAVLAALVVIGGAAVAMTAGGGAAPNATTVAVTSGDFVDYIQIRGDIRPAKSIVLAAPLQSGGDLQIVKLVKQGATIKKGDILVEFDATTLEQRLAERRSDLKSAEGEIAQLQAQQKINVEEQKTALMKAKYDVERAKLDLGKRDLVSEIEYQQAKLALADAEERRKEIEAKGGSGLAGAEADLVGKQRKRDKAKFDVDRIVASIEALHLRAPADGTVNILENPRTGNMFGGGGTEFREGDRAWAGASILELPDLSSIHLEARLDESDRGRLKVGQQALVKIEAVPGKDFAARVDLISVLARVDFSSGWPPVRNFDLGLVLSDPDPRIRPGMTATARIAADRLPNATLVPSEAIFQRDGRPVVYRLNGSKFDEQPIEIVRRGREQAAVSAGVAAGDKLAVRRPDADLIRRKG